MSSKHLEPLNAAIARLRRARRAAIAKLTAEKSPENREFLTGLHETLGILRAVRQEERGMLNRVLNWPCLLR
jgi:hypothetical protein